MPADMKNQFPNIMTFGKRMSLLFLMLLGLFITNNLQAQEKMKIRKIVLDAGHGGKDPGNLGTTRYETTEKDITLSVTLKLGKYLEELLPDVEVIYTRKDDSYPTLNDRVELANKEKADLFISIHCDAFTKSSAKGSGTFIMGMHKTKESLRVAMKENASIYKEDNYEENYDFDPSDPDTYLIMSLRQNVFLENSMEFSNMVQGQFKDRVGRIDRTVKQAGFYVISYTSMPSALIELGFLTNAEEEDFLNSDNGQDLMASAIYRAIRDYKQKIEGIQGEVQNIEETEVKEIMPEVEIVDISEIKPATDLNLGIVHEKIKRGIRFEVQILTSSVAIEKDSEAFLGLNNVNEYETNGLFKYTVGRTNEYKTAKQMKKMLKENGFEGAFVIAFDGEQRIELHEAISANN